MPPQRFSRDDADRIVLETNSYSEAARRLGVSVTSISRSVRRRGITTTFAKTVNHRYFETIDTEHKAYFLGLLAADGCVSRGRVALKLVESDSHIVEEFRAAVGSTHSLYRSVPIGGYKPGSPCVELQFSSSQMVSDLARHGITPRKSLTAEAWSGPAHLMRHYWRGVIDGDGWIGKSYPFQLGLIGSKSMVSAFARYAFEVAGARICPAARKSVWATFLNTTTAQTMARHLYDASSVSMTRKRLLAEALGQQYFQAYFRGWKSLKLDRIIELVRRHQDWKLVAGEIGVPLTTLNTYITRKFHTTKWDIWKKCGFKPYRGMHKTHSIT